MFLGLGMLYEVFKEIIMEGVDRRLKIVMRNNYSKGVGGIR